MELKGSKTGFSQNELECLKKLEESTILDDEI